MSDGRALLAAICAQPDEDTPRLAYADWLDETGQSERAELIRVQVELARLPPDEEGADTATRRAELDLRQEQLLKDAARRATWAKPVNPPPAGYEEFAPDANRFVRGFPEFAGNAYTERNGYLTVGEALFDVSPLHTLSCRNVHGKEADRFLALPWLSRVRRLSISTNLDRSRWEPDGGVRSWLSGSDGTDVATTEKLFAAPALANLEALELRNWEFGPPGARGARRALTSLRKLELWGGSVAGPGAFVRLGELLPAEVRLREFKLASCRYGTDELRALAALPQLQRLERLTLGSRYGDDGWQAEPLDAEGVSAVTSAPYWRHLRAFRDGIGHGGIAAAALDPATPPAPNLRTLGFESGTIGMGFVSLSCSPLLASVTALDLSGTKPGDFLASYLTWSPHLGRLLSLKLDDCEVATKGVRALAGAPFAAQLVRLSLAHNSLRRQAVDVLVAPGNFPRLCLLDVSRGVPNRAQQDRLRARFGAGMRF